MLINKVLKQILCNLMGYNQLIKVKLRGFRVFLLSLLMFYCWFFAMFFLFDVVHLLNQWRLFAYLTFSGKFHLVSFRARGLQFCTRICQKSSKKTRFFIRTLHHSYSNYTTPLYLISAKTGC